MKYLFTNFRCLLQLTALKKIGGSSGKANGTKVIRSVVNKLISPEFMAQISWTGKSSGGKPAKIKFQAYTAVIQLISDVCIIADRNLNEQTILNDLKYKVIKYAYANTQTTSTTTTMTSSSSSPSRSSASSPTSEYSLDSRSSDGTNENSVQSHSIHQSKAPPLAQAQPQQHAQPSQQMAQNQPLYPPQMQNFHHSQYLPQPQNVSQQPMYSHNGYSDPNYFNQNYSNPFPTYTNL